MIQPLVILEISCRPNWKRKYFGWSITRSSWAILILLGQISKKLTDEDALWLVRRIVDSFEKSRGKGIPLGNVTSQLFANVYLNGLDQFMKHKLKTKFYIRYCDDFIIVHEDKNYFINLIPFVQMFLERSLKLQLHPRKVILRKLTEGVDFLGYIVRPGHTLLRTRTKRRVFKKLSGKVIDFKVGKSSPEKFNHSLQSYLGMLKHCEAEKIRNSIKSLYEYAKVDKRINILYYIGNIRPAGPFKKA